MTNTTKVIRNKQEVKVDSIEGILIGDRVRFTKMFEEMKFAMKSPDTSLLDGVVYIGRIPTPETSDRKYVRSMTFRKQDMYIVDSGEVDIRKDSLIRHTHTYSDSHPIYAKINKELEEVGL